MKAGGIELSIYFMPGIGGKDLSAENAESTAFVINQVQPDFVRVRTAAVKAGTELYDDWQAGAFELAGDDDKVREIRRIIELADADIPTRIVSDHMVNLLQNVEGCMGSGAGNCGDFAAGTVTDSWRGDKERLLALIDEYLGMPETDRRVFQLLRRSLRAYDLDDLANLPEQEFNSLRELVSQSSARDWDIKMNHYICRYI